MAEGTIHRVFLLPETLEAILLQLSIQDLLINAQRVNRRWKTAIESSVALQQALYFRSSPSSPSRPTCLNPLLQKYFPPWFRFEAIYKANGGPTLFTSVPWAASPEVRESFTRADASWRRMLPCQPAKRALVVRGKRDSPGIREWYGKVRFEKGLTMGHLYDFTLEYVAKTVGRFWVQWEETEQDDAEKDDKLTLCMGHGLYKSRWKMSTEAADMLRSEAFEELLIDIKEEKRTRRWFGVPFKLPAGGWQLEQEF